MKIGIFLINVSVWSFLWTSILDFIFIFIFSMD